MAEGVKLATAYVEIIPSMRGVQKAIASEFGGVGKAGRDAGRDAGTGLVGSVKGAIGPLAGIVAGAFAIGAVTDFFKSAVSGASDLQQNIGGIEAVMKTGSKQFLAYSKTAATSVGISASEYDRLGTLIGSQLKNGGVATDQLAGKTSDLIKTGADLSAMFGGSAADAVDALSSALKGERDPIERYGVSLNQAKIDAEAASLGFKKVGGSLSTEANQAATLSLIMKQTADAHGAFGRENDTLAHKQQVLNALWQDGKARLGTAFLPAITAVTGALITGLGPALNVAEKGTQAFSGFIAGIDLSGLGTAATGAFGTVKNVIGSFASGLAPFLTPIMSALTPLIPAFFQLAGAVSPFQIVLKALTPLLPVLGGLLGQVGLAIANTLGQALPLIVPLIVQLSSTIAGVLTQALGVIIPLLPQIAGLFTSLVPVITQVLGAVLPLVSTLITQLAPVFVNLISSVLPPVIQILGTIVQAVGPLVTIILAQLIPVIKALLPVVSTVFNSIVPVIKGALQIVLGVVQVVTGLLTGNWKQVWTGLKNIVGGVVNTIVAMVRGFMANIGSVVSNGLKAVIAYFGAVGGRIKSSLDGLGSLLVSVGKNLVDGLVNGIKEKIAGVASILKDGVAGAVKGVKDFLGIHSPSRVFIAIGRYVTQGFAEGIVGNVSQVKTAMRTLANKTLDAYNSTSIEKKLLKAATSTTAAVYSKNGTTVRAISAAQRDFITSVVNANTTYMVKLANQSATVAKRLTAANKNLQTLLKQAASYKASVLSSLTASDPTQESSAAGYVQTLTSQVAQTKTLTGVLAKLKKAGLDSTTYQSLVSKGLASLPIAQSILASGKSGIKSIGSLQSQLSSSSKTLANQATSDMFGAGVQAAKGLVKGLQSQRSALAKTMRSIAKDMVSSIKAELGIHSPSRVFAEIGAFIPAGLAKGVDGNRALANAAVNRMLTIPSYSSRASVGELRTPAPAAAGPITQEINVTMLEQDPQLLARKWNRELDKALAGVVL